MRTETLPILVADADPAQARAIGEWLKAWGRSVEVVHDGCQALGLLMRQSFAAVFLDIHLPIVGGIDATQALRAGESPNRRLPIVGLQTQHDGYSVGRLIDAGMDAVLTKPFPPSDLHAVLMRLLPAAPAEQPAALPTVEDPGDDCLDPQKIAEFIAGDRELFAEMVELLEGEFPRRMQQIAAAIQQGEGKALERAAHSLKGALSYFCNKPPLQSLQTLERCGRELDFSSADGLATQLNAMFPRLQQELREAMTATADTGNPRVSDGVAIAAGY